MECLLLQGGDALRNRLLSAHPPSHKTISLAKTQFNRSKTMSSELKKVKGCGQPFQIILNVWEWKLPEVP
jgi:hypothetical protein